MSAVNLLFFVFIVLPFALFGIVFFFILALEMLGIIDARFYRTPQHYFNVLIKSRNYDEIKSSLRRGYFYIDPQKNIKIEWLKNFMQRENRTIYFNIDGEDPKGLSAIMTAIEMKNKKMIILLVRHGANISMSNLERIQKLISKDFSDKLKQYVLNSLPEEPLYIAIRDNNMPLVNLLIDSGYSMYRIREPYSPFCINALSLAIMKKNSEMVKLLYNKGFDLKTKAYFKSSNYYDSCTLEELALNYDSIEIRNILRMLRRS